jgi:hypothetical protein
LLDRNVSGVDIFPNTVQLGATVGKHAELARNISGDGEAGPNASIAIAIGRVLSGRIDLGRGMRRGIFGSVPSDDLNTDALKPQKGEPH